MFDNSGLVFLNCDSMSTIQDLKALGDSTGLNGKSLQTFIEEQQAEERNKRTLEREEQEKK